MSIPNTAFQNCFSPPMQEIMPPSPDTFDIGCGMMYRRSGTG